MGAKSEEIMRSRICSLVSFASAAEMLDILRVTLENLLICNLFVPTLNLDPKMAHLNGPETVQNPMLDFVVPLLQSLMELGFSAGGLESREQMRNH